MDIIIAIPSDKVTWKLRYKMVLISRSPNRKKYFGQREVGSIQRPAVVRERNSRAVT